ncbi:MAG: ATPase component of various ABC-type transport system with duplicated ATPase domain [Bacilli bacterium]|nr:ATPase component of various ABC-type transport system with duplicated ATPase domain [Bacilli bacterium]
MSDLHVEKLTFAYPNSAQPVLNSIDLNIRQGEFLLVAGPSGCGKSTLGLALAGLIPARVQGRYRGNVFFGDKAISKMDIHEISQHIGMVFQNPENQLIHLDVESEVAFGPENLGIPRSEIQHRVHQSLHYTRMDAFLGSQIFALSGGQKQRIAISASLSMLPDVLVLDEPTSDLDPLGTQEVLRVLRELNRTRGMTIILIEHKIDEVIPWVDRVLLMDKGQVVIDSPPRQAFQNPQLWNQLGVSVPEIVQLAVALPDVFPGNLPLSVEEAYNTLRGTEHAQAILTAAESHKDAIGDSLIHPGATVLDWQNVSLSYGDHQVLNHINLQINANQWVALAGPNGSGKTSLAALAMGFQSPTNGAIRCFGQDVDVDDILKQSEKISYLFQAADNMLFTSTVEEELLFGLKHRGKNQQMEKNTLQQLLGLLDLGNHVRDNPFQLSHGQRKRLAIGALLACHPQVMILDEPTTGQDEGHARDFLQFLNTLREQLKMTYLMITHDMRAVAQYATSLVVLQDGEVRFCDTPDRVFANYEGLARCEIVPPPIAHLHGRLSEGHANRVCLTLQQFLCLFPQKEAAK